MTGVVISTGQGDPRFLNRIAWRDRWLDREKSIERARRALQLARAIDTAAADIEQATALRTLAWQARWRGDFDRAMDFGLMAESKVAESEAPALRGDVYATLGVVYYSRHRLDLADGAISRGLSIIGDADAGPTTIDLLVTQATVQRYLGHGARASVLLGRALELASGPELGRVEHNLSRTYLDEGEVELAAERASTAVDLCLAHHNRILLPYAHEVMGATQARQRKFDAAAASYARGLEAAIADKDDRAQCQLLFRQGQLDMDRGEPGRALEVFSAGEKIAGRLRYVLWQADFARDVARALEAMREFEAAVRAHNRAWALEAQKRR